ncbi:MAG: hypothetical protein D6748_14490 [Calditrichaeota bacterium]|nr:MAG: hypothetical protein D6748_14490 [Calditrichota bacterium]
MRDAIKPLSVIPGVFTFFLYFLIFTQPGFSQMPTKSLFHVHFNHPPDTFYVDGKPMQVVPGEKYSIQPGPHTFKVVADCFYPIEKVIDVRPGHVKYIPFKLRHYMTIEKRQFNYLRWINYFTGASGVIASGASSTGLKYILPLHLVGLAEFWGWHHTQEKHFDTCTNIYNGKLYPPAFFQLFLGLASMAKREISFETEGQVEKVFRTPGVPYVLRWLTQQQVRFNPNSRFLSNYGFTVGAHLNISSLLTFSVSTNLYPFAATEFEVSDSLRFYMNTGSRTIKENAFLYLLNADAHITVYKKINQQLSLSLGRYWSNKISGNVEVPLTMPDIQPLQDSTATISYDYSFQAKGLRVGFQYQYQIRRNLSFMLHYFYHFTSTFNVNNSERKRTLFFVNVGIRYGLVSI